MKRTGMASFRVSWQPDRDKVFELSRAPLLRLAIFQMANNSWEIVLNSHHLILDGWSLSLVMADVLKLYGGESLPRPLPYADYAEWLKGQAVEASLDWWQNTLAGFEKPNRIDLPVEKREEGFGEKTVRLGPETTRKLDRATRELATTRSALLQAIWATLISRLSGDGDVVFGNVVSGRPAQLPGIESMVGMFINTVPVRVETAEKNFRDIVSDLTTFQAERDEHEYAPLHQVQGRTSISKGSPLFETLFVYENYPIDDRLKNNGQNNFKITHGEGIEAAHYPLTLAVLPDGRLTLKLSYDRQRYDEQCARQPCSLV